MSRLTQKATIFGRTVAILYKKIAILNYRLQLVFPIAQWPAFVTYLLVRRKAPRDIKNGTNLAKLGMQKSKAARAQPHFLP